jgi:hypothetical protein
VSWSQVQADPPSWEQKIPNCHDGPPHSESAVQEHDSADLPAYADSEASRVPEQKTQQRALWPQQVLEK